VGVDPPAAAESNGQKCLHLVGSWAEPCVCGQLLPGRMTLKLTWVGLIWVDPGTEPMTALAERVIPELEVSGATKPAAASSRQTEEPRRSQLFPTSEDPTSKRSGIRRAGARSDAKSC
jgi:hypothetical protein